MVSGNPQRFYQRVVKLWLGRHPVLGKCEVRISGRGLHAILWFDKPVVFEKAGDRERWAAIVQVIQAALPVDPDQPGITATTRALGSINSKNNAKVSKIKAGEPVTVYEVLALFKQMCESPFKTVLKILTGSDCVSPCPICEGLDTKLVAGDRTGFCYGSCGKVKLAALYDGVLAARKVKVAKGCRHVEKAK